MPQQRVDPSMHHCYSINIGHDDYFTNPEDSMPSVIVTMPVGLDTCDASTTVTERVPKVILSDEMPCTTEREPSTVTCCERMDAAWSDFVIVRSPRIVTFP